MEKLFDWAQMGESPLSAYAVALLARALSIQEVAAKHLQGAAQLVGSSTPTSPVNFFKPGFCFCVAVTL